MSGRKWWFRYGVVGGLCIWGAPLIAIGFGIWEMYDMIENRSVKMSD